MKLAIVGKSTQIKIKNICFEKVIIHVLIRIQMVLQIKKHSNFKKSSNFQLSSTIFNFNFRLKVQALVHKICTNSV